MRTIREYCCPPGEQRTEEEIDEEFRRRLQQEFGVVVIEMHMFASQMEMMAALANDVESDDEGEAPQEQRIEDDEVAVLDQRIAEFGLELTLAEIEVDCIKKASALIRNARKGCSTLQLLAAGVERDIAEVNAEAQRSNAFLDEPRIMSFLCQYDAMNMDSEERRVPLMRLLQRRDYLKFLRNSPSQE